MKTQPHDHPVFRIVAVLAVVALTSVACSLNLSQGSTFGPVIDITIDQDTFDNMSVNSNLQLGKHCRDYAHVNSVDLHDGFIRILVTKDMPDGSEVDGSLDFFIGEEQGVLVGRITTVDIPGLTLTDRCIIETNEELKFALAHMLVSVPGDVVFKEVVLEEGVLRMKLQVLLQD